MFLRPPALSTSASASRPINRRSSIVSDPHENMIICITPPILPVHGRAWHLSSTILTRLYSLRHYVYFVKIDRTFAATESFDRQTVLERKRGRNLQPIKEANTQFRHYHISPTLHTDPSLLLTLFALILSTSLGANELLRLWLSTVCFRISRYDSMLNFGVGACFWLQSWLGQTMRRQAELGRAHFLTV